ncbi:hypothetical protein GQX74_011203 [Glossina fuscipes]|nr:hypothetical protein GQX74_011203 [Glossina fuscipes]
MLTSRSLYLENVKHYGLECLFSMSYPDDLMPYEYDASFPIRDAKRGPLIQRLVAICHEGDLDEYARIEPLTPDEITELTAVLTHDELVRICGILSERRLISFFTVLGSDGNTTEHEFIRATFTMVATIGKNSFTDSWVNSRWNALITDAPDTTPLPELEDGATAEQVRALVMSHGIPQ